MQNEHSYPSSCNLYKSFIDMLLKSRDRAKHRYIISHNCYYKGKSVIKTICYDMQYYNATFYMSAIKSIQFFVSLDKIWNVFKRSLKSGILGGVSFLSYEMIHCFYGIINCCNFVKNVFDK